MAEQGLMILPHTTAVGLELPPDFSIVAWAGYARAIAVWDSAAHFYLGDLMLYAQSKGADFEHEATQIAADLNFAPKTLQNAMYLAKRFPTHARQPGVNFSLYREVSGLSDKEAAFLLDRAVKEFWTARDLAKEVRALKRGGDANENPEVGPNRHNARALEAEVTDVAFYPEEMKDSVALVVEAKIIDTTLEVLKDGEVVEPPQDGIPARPFFEEEDLQELELAISQGEKSQDVEILRLIADLRRARGMLQAIQVEVQAIADSPQSMGDDDIEHLSNIMGILGI